VEKSYREAQKPNTTVVMLLPARTGNGWFHDYILDKAEIRFIRGRVQFGESKQNAPFDSMIVIWK
jgi:site-specific DNA-methyltransferase (adenine-specific)